MIKPENRFSITLNRDLEQSFHGMFVLTCSLGLALIVLYTARATDIVKTRLLKDT